MQLAEKNKDTSLSSILRKVENKRRREEIRAGWKSELTAVNGICLTLLGIYLYYFLKSLPRWFHPAWTTDDALQQVFPFHEVLSPGVFTNDLITEVMVGYLAPIHYWVSYAGTWLTGDPIMMGHWVMLLQLTLTSLFLFLAIRSVSATAPAILGVVWLLHTRQIVQRMTGGLPRGWAAVVICAALYFMLSKRHRAVLITLFAGCLLHPPATLVVALAYGLYLTFGFLYPKTRAQFVKPLLTLVLLSPIYIYTTYSVVERPEHIGQMVSFEEASQMPEFQYPHGRFPFTPLRPLEWELRTYSFQAFIGRFFKPMSFFRQNTRSIVVVALLCLIGIAAWRRRGGVPALLYSFLAAILMTYLASRLLAFKLYVPNRHLQFPMAFFFIIAFSVAAWRAFYRGEEGGRSSAWKQSWQSLTAMLAVAVLVGFSSGSGLDGDANFNYSRTKKGMVFEWVRANTPRNALIGGHPTFIDGVLLFGERRALITTETAHPFYPKYNQEVQRRLKIVLSAHYSESLEQLYKILAPAGVDYFVFERKRFYPEALEAAEYHPPLDTLVKELASRHYSKYAYRQLPAEVDLEIAPYMPFKDAYAAVVDMHKLGQFLSERRVSQDS
jgi:hypothetical protein